MKFIGVLVDDSPWVARLDDDDRILPLASVPAFWADASGWQARASTIGGEPQPRAAFTEVPPVPDSARILCVGLNYRAHAAEGGREAPSAPTIFGRWTPSLTVTNVPVPLPLNEGGLDWEAEVAVFVGERLWAADTDQAFSAIFGYSTFNDLSARKAQNISSQFTLGKNADLSGPMGHIVSSDIVGDLRDGIQVQTRVNGTQVQNGNTRDLIFPVDEILALISQTMTLHPGDVLVSGTPEGVGYVRNPPWLLQVGDVVEVEIEKLGILTTPIGGPEVRPGS